MRLLLDTQALILLERDPGSIPSRTLDMIADRQNERFLSIVSPLEMQIKLNTGKLRLDRPVRKIVQFELDRGAMELLLITLEHIDELSRLPAHHKDPFDRLLIAQAIHEGLTIVTGDQTIARYPVATLWD